jgi:hypothetical protein
MEFRFKNPMTVDAKGNNYRQVPMNGSLVSSEEAARMAQRSGHDGIVINNVRDSVYGGETPATSYQALQRGTTYSPITGDLLYANGRPAAGVSAAQQLGKQSSRKLDSLGYYSKLDEVLQQFRPTDTVTRETLAQRGVKASELEARGLGNAFDNGGVKVGDLKPGEVPRVNEVVYDGFDYQSPNATKWHNYSLDPNNPSYRETVLHLPGSEAWQAEQRAIADEFGGRMRLATSTTGEQAFQGGHWSEPNVFAHMRTSMQRTAEGKNAFHVDELQSDWGQKLRDGGVRDEAKIAELKAAFAKAADAIPSIDLDKDAQHLLGKNFSELSDHDQFRIRQHSSKFHPSTSLIRAEIATAEAATPGHPLVNTTDQWTTTAIRRAMQQAVDANADGIALPSGKTVQSYGMHGGAEKAANGMDYAYDKMYPNTLGKELAKLDPSIKRIMQNLAGHEDKGPFSYFPLTEAAKANIREGLPLFTNAPQAAVFPLAQQDRRDRQR